jgi:hypothetical protein
VTRTYATVNSQAAGHLNADPWSVAVIGSFKQHYVAVCGAIALFRDAGWTVTSPAGTEILEEGIDFVRFSSDDTSLSDACVQSVTLRNIFAADLVYVVAPEGYVGRTTCYEVGRLIQARRPVYVSAHPIDLPVQVPAHFVLSPEALVARFAMGAVPVGWYDEGNDQLATIERELTRGAQR